MIISSAFGWFAGIRGINSFFWRLFAGLLAVIVLSSFLGFGVHTYLNRDEARYGKVDVFVGGRKAALIIYQLKGQDALVEWLKSPGNVLPTVYIVDGHGSEINGRPYTAFAVFEHSNHDLPFFNPFGTGIPIYVLFLVALILTAFVSAILAYYYTRPLRKLDGAMRAFAEGKLDTRVENSIGRADAEVAALAGIFDKMAGQISRLINRQRRLFHDVSHELRSPLARIDVALDIARRDADRVGPSLDRIEREVDELDRLVGSLLAYARYEQGAGMPLTPGSISAVTAEVVENTAFEAQKKNVSVVLEDELPSKFVLPINADALRSAMENILRNGLRQTPAGSRLSVTLTATSRFVRISLCDQGPGMPPEEIEHAFDPFVRGSHEQTGTGFGLGLAIAQRAVQAHFGRIEARNLPTGGFEVRIDLPRTEAVR